MVGLLHRRFIAPPLPMDPTYFRQGRMSLAGPQILDERGDPWVGRGFNWGHGELGNDSDAANAASRGFNCVRIIVRWWGTWGGSILDGEDDSTTIKVALAYLSTIYLRVVQAKQAGLKVALAFDSNCGQKERVGDTTCAIGTGSPQTFFTTAGASKRAQMQAIQKWLARALLGLVDFWEPIVEPDPTTTIPSGDIETDVKQFQDECMQQVLSEDPNMLFIIGPAPAYQSGKVYGWYEPSWAARNNVIYTCNLLDNALTDPDLATRVGKLVSLRTDYGAPIVVQQIGSTIDTDPINDNLNLGLGLLNTAAGGSVSWWWWEWISQSATSYGPYSGDPVTRRLNTPRMYALQQAAQAPRTYA